MNKKLLAIGSLAAVSLYAPHAAMAAQATANATATIQQAVDIYKNTDNQYTGGDLAFGTMLALGSSGTVTIDPAKAHSSQRSATSVTLIAESTGLTKYGAAEFICTGAKSTNFTITVPATSITIKDNGGTGSNSMTVTDFTAGNLTTSVTGGTLDASTGTSNFFVGGTLNVGASQAAGTYTGTFNVTVAYN
jgi:hypothetical protein